jgi:uncharacterized protein YjiS (DUF1127 family)
MADIAEDRLINSHLSRVAATLRLCRRRRDERAALARLDARELHDIGMTPTARAYELRKPFWRE